MTGEKDVQKLKKTKITKGKLKAFLVNKYDGVIAEKIVKVFGDAFKLNKDGSLSFDEYCGYISDLINNNSE